jgi:cardiolipin synthase
MTPDAPKSPRYDARHLLLVPGLLSLARVPLAIAFPFVVKWPFVGFAVLAAAGLTDVLDGWYARRFKQTTVTGAAIDPITDKLFVTAVVVTLALTGKLGLGSIALLATRELGELPLVVWFVLTHRQKNRAGHPAANVPGKAATFLQFVTVAAAMFQSPFTGALLLATAVMGAVAALIYWIREIAAPHKQETREERT